MAEWEIEKTIGKCFATEKEIVPGEQYFAALVETEEGLKRRDFCEQYWEEKKPQVYCYWKTKIPEAGQKKQLFIDDQMLITFFERLENETDPEKINFRFVLAMILMRKRILKYHESYVSDGKEFWKLRVTGEKDFVEVFNPKLDEQQIEQLACQIGTILQVEL